MGTAFSDVVERGTPFDGLTFAQWLNAIYDGDYDDDTSEVRRIDLCDLGASLAKARENATRANTRG